MPPAASVIRSKRRRPAFSITDICTSDGPSWIQGNPVFFFRVLPAEIIVSSQKCPRKHQFWRRVMPKLAHPRCRKISSPHTPAAHDSFTFARSMSEKLVHWEPNSVLGGVNFVPQESVADRTKQHFRAEIYDLLSMRSPFPVSN
jgi:hypothetical protein